MKRRVRLYMSLSHADKWEILKDHEAWARSMVSAIADTPPGVEQVFYLTWLRELGYDLFVV